MLAGKLSRLCELNPKYPDLIETAGSNPGRINSDVIIIF